MRSKLAVHNSPLWEKCEELTRHAEWQSVANNGFPLRRSVTWAYYPTRFLLTEHAELQGRFSKKITTKLFELTSLSAQRADTGLHDYRRYFLAHSALIGIIERQTQLPHQLDEASRLAIEQDYDYVLKNRLFAPNTFDELDFESIVNAAYLDGVEVYEG